MIGPFFSNRTVKKKIQKNVDFILWSKLHAITTCYFLHYFSIFSPLCPNLGHQAHQNNNQSLVETRFNGTPQLSPCKFHEKKCLFSDKIESLAQKKNRNKHWKRSVFSYFQTNHPQKCQTQNNCKASRHFYFGRNLRFWRDPVFSEWECNKNYNKSRKILFFSASTKNLK